VPVTPKRPHQQPKILNSLTAQQPNNLFLLACRRRGFFGSNAGLMLHRVLRTSAAVGFVVVTSILGVRVMAAPHYHVEAAITLASPQLRGTVTIDVVNESAAALDEVVLFTFPDRFRRPDTQVDDVNRPFVYPREEFHPGWMDILGVEVDAVQVVATPLSAPELPDGCAIRVTLPAPLPPAASTRVTIRFETFVPDRYGSFGVADGMLTAIGGWYPYLAWLRPDGSWALDTLPAAADFDVRLTPDPALAVVLNGQYFPHPEPLMQTTVRGVPYLTLVAAPDLLRDTTAAGSVPIVFFHRPTPNTHRVLGGPDPVEVTLSTLREIVEQRPPELPPPSASLVVVAAPLRWYLTVPGEGMVVISDRALRIDPLLRPFHERQMAQAVYAELLGPQLESRESAGDYVWVREGLSHALATQLLHTTQPETRSTQDWIELFNIFAIVDRFETAPKVPFAETMFENVPEADPLHERIDTFNNDLPPGHVVLGKLQQRLGDDEYHRIIDRCVAAAESLRQCTARESGEDLSAFYVEWLQAYPEIHYSLADVQTNTDHDDAYVSEFTVRRESSRPIQEPVVVEVRSIGGAPVRVRWDGSGESARLSAVTPHRACQVVIDPDRHLIETTRADNASPPSLQVVLDSAEVEVSSTEFGISGLVVARQRYDYTKDLAAVGLYTNRSIGVGAGPRVHWGTPIDANSYRNNVFFYYSAQALDASFRDNQNPQVRTAGHTNGLGLRYDYTTILSYNNPTESVDGRLFVDWFDRALDSSYSYVDWGGGLTFTHPLWTPRTIFAGEVLNGFSEPLGSSVVPNQGLFSLGGSRSIRGIGAEDELARNIFVLRAELRQSLYPEVDLSLLDDALVVRRTQVQFFVDTGQVSNSAGAIYDPAGYAVGVGIGLGALTEFFGFFPVMAYLELATQARGPGNASDIQVLFGTRQAF
jgi:surface antigen Omp85-like protein